MDGVQQKGLENKRYPIGLAYVIIPDNIDRDKYVADCKRRGRVSILTEYGDTVLDCPVGLSILDNIEFPNEIGKLGSQLIYNTEFIHNKPIIIDRILKDDESSMSSENEFRLERFTDNGSVSIIGSAKDGNLFVKVDGKTDKGGKIYIDIGNNSTNSGEIVVNIKGNFKMELQNMLINAIETIIHKSVENINIDSTEGVINLGNTEEQEPLLKGDETVTQLQKDVQALTDLLQSIANISPSPVTSGAPDPTWAVWQAAVATIVDRADLANVKSEKTFTQ